MCPGEFEDYLVGCVEGLRETRWLFAKVAGPIYGLGGVSIPLAVLAGEQTEYGDLAEVAKEETLEDRRLKYERKNAALAEKRQQELLQWLPDGIELGPLPDSD